MDRASSARDRDTRSVVLRPATADDRERIIEVLCSEPGDEAVALMGSVDLARRYRVALIEHEEFPSPSRVTIVAEHSDRVVGILQYGIEDGGRRGKLAHLRVVVSLVGPIGLLRRIPRILARTRVEIPIPEGSLHLATVYVDPECKGEGIGSRLLEWAEHEAARIGAPRMSMITLTTSGALGWYERHGFAKTQTVQHPSYERRLKIPGRVLMVKELAS